MTRSSSLTHRSSIEFVGIRTYKHNLYMRNIKIDVAFIGLVQDQRVGSTCWVGSQVQVRSGHMKWVLGLDDLVWVWFMGHGNWAIGF